jgi:hypothetical protein
MNDKKAKQLVNEVYNAIEGARSLDEIKSIPKNLDIDMSRIMDESVYPKINFKLSKEDLKEVDKLILDENHYLKLDLDLEKESVLTKLLYAMVWKNGDLKKIRHIIYGVLEEKPDYKENDGIVLYYFGRYLTNPTKHSIIDQHVIRTFLLFNCEVEEDYKKIRVFKGVKEKNNDIVENYLKWLNNSIKPAVKDNPDAFYFIDKVLFSLGKSIKLKG